MNTFDTTGSNNEQAGLQILSKDTLSEHTLSEETLLDNNLTKDYINYYISDEGGRKLRLFDKDETSGLELFSYTKEEDDYKLNRCRGVIFDNKNNLVMESFPYTKYYTTTETNRVELNEKLKDLFNECMFFDSHEGTLLRLFYYNNRWYTATNKKLNAFQSRWSSKESFGTSLKRAIEREYETNEKFRKNIPDGDGNLFERFKLTLDKTKQYMFLVRNMNENKILCKPPSHPTFYHVGTFFNGTLSMTENVNVPYPNRLHFKSFEELFNYVDNTVSDINNIEKQGVIIYLPNNLQYKVVSPYYKKCKDIRGNQPSIKYRYLQVRNDDEMKTLLYNLYPDLKNLFDSYEYTLNNITKNIHNAYYTRFIKKQYITLPQEEFKIVRDCHQWYTSDRNNRIVTIEKVYDILNQQQPFFLNKLLRNYKNNQYHNSNQHNTTNTQNSTNNTINKHYNLDRTDRYYRTDRKTYNSQHRQVDTSYRSNRQPYSERSDTNYRTDINNTNNLSSANTFIKPTHNIYNRYKNNYNNRNNNMMDLTEFI